MPRHPDAMVKRENAQRVLWRLLLTELHQLVEGGLGRLLRFREKHPKHVLENGNEWFVQRYHVNESWRRKRFRVLARWCRSRFPTSSSCTVRTATGPSNYDVQFSESSSGNKDLRQLSSVSFNAPRWSLWIEQICHVEKMQLSDHAIFFHEIVCSLFRITSELDHMWNLHLCQSERL